jgi:hypothetical protein
MNRLVFFALLAALRERRVTPRAVSILLVNDDEDDDDGCKVARNTYRHTYSQTCEIQIPFKAPLSGERQGLTLLLLHIAQFSCMRKSKLESIIC